MSDATSLFAILTALLLGAISPGPSFLLVARTAVARGRITAVGAALGMGIGAALFASLAVAGLHVVLVSVSWLYDALRLVGALYLLYVAMQLWRSAASIVQFVQPAGCDSPSFTAGVCSGLLVQLSNPKTALVHAGVFGALLPSQASTWLLLGIPPSVLALEAAWYGVVACGLSEKGPRRLYLKSKTVIDRTASVALGLLGSRMILDLVRNER